MKKQKYLMLVILPIFILSIFSSLNIADSQIVGSGSIDSGLVGYWRFDENSGVSALDSSGNGLTGTITNGLYNSTAKYNSGLIFNGVNTSISIPNTALLQITQNLTISFWVYFNSVVPKQSLIYKYWGGEFEVQLYGNGRIEFDHTGNSYTTLNQVVYAKNWTQITIVRNFNEQKIRTYINSIEVQNFNIIANATTSTNAITFGNEAGSNWFNGTLDNVRIYNRVLSSSEISTLYNGLSISVSYDAGSTVTPNGTVLVGVDQSQSFSIGASNGYISWTQYINGVAYAPLAVRSIDNVQTNQTFYVTSQFTGIYQPTPTPTPTITPTPTPSPSPTPNPTPTPPLYLTGLNFMIVAFILIVVNAVFCFAKIPLLAIPIGFTTWIIFFVFSISLDAFNFILIIMALIFASASIILNIKEIRS